MTSALITGAKGFIGRNLAAHLRRREDVRLFEYNRDNTEAELRDWAAQADVVFHLAGVNRPRDVSDFETGNAGFTARLCALLGELGCRPRVIAASSIQAELDNPYGVSKLRAEETLRRFAAETGAPVSIFRLTNVFGKWCRPNYNSVTATFCHNIGRDLPIQIHHPDHRLELAYVDDVVAAMLAEAVARPARADVNVPSGAIPTYSLTLGDLAGRIQFFHEMQQSLRVPDFSVRFNQQLYATYLSYVEPDGWSYGLELKRDARGDLAEFIKSPSFGQIFVSRTLPGVTRGNHFHHTKTEKFLVLSGEGLIRFRSIEGTEVVEFHVWGEDYRVVEIPPGYVHSITNVGDREMITLFWASETFDPDRPDTYFMPVDPPAASGIGPTAQAELAGQDVS